MLSAVEKRYEKLRFLPHFPDLMDEDQMMNSIYMFWNLDAHGGCVNTLRWNKSGSLLASGSDDCDVIIWRNGAQRVRHETEHDGNVFGVEFMPNTNDVKIVTGAADEYVIFHDLETKQKTRHYMDGRVKRLCTVESDPTMVWAAVEDTKAVHQFDTRDNLRSVVVQSTEEKPVRCGKTVAISQENPNLMVVGFDETTVRLYDRRNFEDPILNFAPLAVDNNSYHATHVAFNKIGTEVVVNYGSGGGIHVFSVDSSKDPKIMERFHAALDKPQEPIISSHILPHAELREAGSALIREKKFPKAIDYYSGLIHLNDPDRAFRSICYSNRATGKLLRRRRGDTYSCIRDCVKALEIHSGNSKALFRLIKSFITMEQPILARKCIEKFKEWFPNDNSIVTMENELLQFQYRSNTRPLASVEGYVDYQARYIGSINHETDIKEANFFGSRDQYILSGSDCGHLYAWNRDTSKLMGIWKADSQILNVVQPHPHSFMFATAGIDQHFCLWQTYLERENDNPPDRRVEDQFEFMEKEAGETDGRIPLHMLQDFARDSPQCVQS